MLSDSGSGNNHKLLALSPATMQGKQGRIVSFVRSVDVARPYDGVDCERTLEVRHSSTGILDSRSSRRSSSFIAAVTA